MGAGVFIGAGVHVGQDARIGRGAKIGSHTRIGDRAVITDGMHVPHDTTIADGELVTRSAPARPTLGGVQPARGAESGFAKAA